MNIMYPNILLNFILAIIGDPFGDVREEQRNDPSLQELYHKEKLRFLNPTKYNKLMRIFHIYTRHQVGENQIEVVNDWSDEEEEGGRPAEQKQNKLYFYNLSDADGNKRLKLDELHTMGLLSIRLQNVMSKINKKKQRESTQGVHQSKSMVARVSHFTRSAMAQLSSFGSNDRVVGARWDTARKQVEDAMELNVQAKYKHWPMSLPNALKHADDDREFQNQRAVWKQSGLSFSDLTENDRRFVSMLSAEVMEQLLESRICEMPDEEDDDEDLRRKMKRSIKRTVDKLTMRMETLEGDIRKRQEKLHGILALVKDNPKKLSTMKVRMKEEQLPPMPGTPGMIISSQR